MAEAIEVEHATVVIFPPFGLPKKFARICNYSLQVSGANFLSWPLASQRACYSGTPARTRFAPGFHLRASNTANDDSRAVASRNTHRNRADSHSRNMAVDSHSRNMAVDSRSSHGDSNRLFEWLCGSSPEVRGFLHR